MKQEAEPHQDMDESLENLPQQEERAAADDPDVASLPREVPYADPFDDVFGADWSQASSCILTTASQAGIESLHAAGDGDLSFRDDINSIINSSRPRTLSSAHPSDMHRLQTEHITAGYREGISTAKAATVQQGFDEGFSLGATIGMAAGRLLGTLEGIAEALGPDWNTRAAERLRLAREELSAGRVFCADYWAPDGNWKFPVVVDPATGRAQHDILFADVARSHPLISKWVGIARQEVERYGVDESISWDSCGASANVFESNFCIQGVGLRQVSRGPLTGT
ncbi:Uncharacterized protein ESCO_003281 [Escovopsis weberi]|uniref:Protein YAE1 n=1 Tax=Escovopsis weberi TaxID=150374 RepID=A0A0M8MR39_ESCWE|nr:Uncharacterized protein ESCO_003281 [Escovopsis weberi]